ncbi:cinnamoyl-CoA reductase-like SNL6 [Nymphaea colorata]|nr:cinnamoyl-CoA reductase-like SNL6 [Nymphaea colorata]
MGPPPAMPEAPKSVCVMDASGYLGSRLVHHLLRRGYNVHAAVNNGGELEFLQRLAGEDNKCLKLYSCDPLDYQSIVDAIKGCCGLFYSFEPPKYQTAYDDLMMEVEVRAAHNVLEACGQTESMEKVVFTSSVAAVIWKENRKSMAEFDERHWSEANFCRNFKLWYALSKTLAEKTAWALAMDRGVNMVSVNSGLLTGPDLGAAHPYLKGAAEMYEDGVLVTVDVDYLVDAHIGAFEKESTFGRHICFNRLINREEDAVELARLLAPSATYLPNSKDSKMYEQRISNKKLNKIMVDFTGGIRDE